MIEREGLTCLYLVPTLFHDLVSHPEFAATKTDSVRKLAFAGAAMTDGLLRKVEAAFQPELFVNHYGSSEVYTFTIDQQAPRKPAPIPPSASFLPPLPKAILPIWKRSD